MYYYPNPYSQNTFQSQGGNLNQNLPNQPFINNQVGLKGRPVSSLDEVRAAQIDFDGSLFVFPDVANKRIYTKQINLDGTASLNMYELAKLPADNSQTQIQTDNFVTREEFTEALNEIKAAFEATKTKPEPKVEKSETPQFKF